MSTTSDGSNDPGQPPIRGGAAARWATDEWSVDLAVPTIALAIGAHPDDVEFGAGGTLAKWAAAGCAIHHLVLTDGSKGTWDPDADIVDLVARRRHEQQEASRRLGGAGIESVRFLGRVDGELVADVAARSAVARVIREVRPDVVLAHDPWKRYRLHPDHRAAGLIACDAIVAARDPHFHREHGLPHHRPSALLLWEADEPNHLEDITDHMDAKLAALEAHVSQFESTMKATSADSLEAFRRRVRERSAEVGSLRGLPAAEAFHLMRDL
jgi:LmbE family N-acetylglucosaminyl deacetylase